MKAEVVFLLTTDYKTPQHLSYRTLYIPITVKIYRYKVIILIKNSIMILLIIELLKINK